MKLIQCTVRGFGNLREKTFVFHDGLHAFCHENGWGKTTLSVFLKAMLYGLSTTRSTDLSENERRRFLPWDKLPCGGTLIYEAGGRRYRVERTFSQKTTGADDTCVVYDEQTGAVRPQERPLGETLFGIDADAFERTVFLSERNLSGRCANPTVKAKLADLVGTDADLGDFDTVLRSLDDRRRELYINRKGSTAEINRLDEQIKDLSVRVAELDREITVSMASEHDEVHQKEREGALRALYEALRQESDGLRRPEDGRLFEEQYHAAQSDEAAADERHRATRAAFGEHVPSEAEVLKARQAYMRYRADEQAAQGQGEQEALARFFRRPTDAEELDRMSRTLHTAAPSPVLAILCILLAIVCFPLGFTVHSLFFIGTVLGCLGALYLWTRIRGYKKEQTIAREFLDQYPTATSEPRAAFGEICSNFAKLCLQNKAKASEESAKTDESSTQDADERIVKEFESTYGFVIDGDAAFETILLALTQLRIAEEMHTQARRRVEDTRAHLEAFRKALNPTRRHELDEELSLTQRQLEECRMEEQRIRSERAMLVEKSQRREQLTAQLVSLMERKSACQKEYNTILKTMDFLRLSADRLTARYTKPTQEGFEKYRRLLGGAEDATYQMSVEFELRKDETGELKPLDAYSRGTRDLHALALRLALVDALFEKETPFLIFDDPFASLDDERLDAALSMLARLGKERQILYFTCTQGRMPKAR